MREEVLRLAGPAYTSREQPGVYVRRLEAACQLLHRKLQPASILAARTTSSCPSPHTAPSPAPPTPSAAGNTAAVGLCTLLLADQEVLDVVLALHDIRAAQISELLQCSPHCHALYPPMPSESLGQQLRRSQRSVPGSQLSQFISRLERSTRMEGDPLLYVWDSMHRTMLLVLAALQSLPILPHPQHPDPAATTHTSTTTQLPPGYHRCSACLLLSLRLALRLSQFCNDQLNGVDQLLARLHATLPRLLLGLSTAVSVMQAAGHPEADAHRLLLLRCILHWGPLQLRCLVELGWYNSKDIEEQLDVKPTTSCPDHLARLLASSPAMTGWPGPLPAKPSSEHSSTAGASLGLDHSSGSRSSNSRGGVKGKSTGQGGKGSSTACPKDLAVVNSLAHVAQALCAVLGRQEEGLIMDQLISTCKAEGQESFTEFRTDASCLATATLKMMAREYYCTKYMVRILDAALAPSHLGAVASGHQNTSSSASSPPLLTIVLNVLPRCLVFLRGTVAAVRLGAAHDTHYTLNAFPSCFRNSYSSLCLAIRLTVELCPDVRCRPAMLRLLARTAAAGAHGYSTLVLLLDGAPDYEAGLERTPQLKASLVHTLDCVCGVWVTLLMPHSDTEQVSSDNIRLNDSHPHGQNAKGSAACGRKKVLNQPPSAQQLAPLALDLVWGMDGMLQMMQQHWHMFWPMACEDVSRGVSILFNAACTSLILFGHVIEVLAEPAAVGPAGLAAQPASWLPCGNSLVEGWCSQLLDRMCQLLCINAPDLERPPDHTRLTGCQALACGNMFLPQVQEQLPTSMSPEAKRLLSCLMLVLTVALPLDAWLAVTPSLPAARVKPLKQASAIHDLLTCVEPEQVWSWQALAAGTPAEASLASVLQGTAYKLQLPHLVAPAPQGWQPGRLTLDRGRGPPEFMTLCFPSL